VSLKERVELVLKDKAGSNTYLTNRYTVADVDSRVVRVGARQSFNVADVIGSDILRDHPYDNSGLRYCEVLLAEDGFLIEWIQHPAGDYLLVREETDG
jgi:hypothetical protein